MQKSEQKTEASRYKSTVFLPVTNFPMKGDLPVREPQIISKWKAENIYQKMVEKNSKGSNFTMPDGPPYANGAIHIGHALNKCLKDIVIKYKNMQGFQAVFIPGWDCHGLPIEHAVMKGLTDNKKTATDPEILQMCRAEAAKWVKEQGSQFERLGVLADWENPYMTMSPDYEAEEVREFARAYKSGLVYRGEKPVYWNWFLKTALAEAEVEYHMHRSPSVYVKFPITDDATLKKLGSPQGNVFSLIWTTTPWTLPANVAIAVNEDFDYGVFKVLSGNETYSPQGTEFFILAEKLKESFEKETGTQLSLLSTIKGSALEHTQARHPFYNRNSKIVLGHHVSLEAGTGNVHIAPGHGADDYKIGLKYQLPVLSPVGEDGTYTDEVPEYQGTHIFKANPLIIERMKSLNILVHHKDIEHSYPHCWRSKKPLIFRATPQWFIGLDLPSETGTLREKILHVISETQFFPAWGEARLKAMMENRPDWCLSRQRIWGVPIPVFYCQATGQPLADYNVMMRVADVIEKEGGIDAFYKHPAQDFIQDYKIPSDAPKGFGSQGFRHGKDILDVWFDSGICHAAVQKKRPGMQVPADVYLEGSDQHRGWFNTSLITSMVTNGKPPFKSLITHGFVNDSQGRKMSKSLGNTVVPKDVYSQNGAEILRLWSVYEDYGQDLTCGKEELTRVMETYRRLRNTMRYFLGVLPDFHFEKDQVAYDKMTHIDQWALHELNELISKMTEAYDKYEFYKVYHLLNSFFTVTMSATYLDILKDRLYTWKRDGLPRRSSQTAIYIICDNLMRMMAPVLSFLAEECYEHFPAGNGQKASSIFLLDFPKINAKWNRADLAKDFSELLKVRDETQKQLELLRNQKTIGASLEAHLVISAPGSTLAILKKYNQHLKEFFIVSRVDLVEGELLVKASKAEGDKCARCWVYSTELSQKEETLGICPKCVEALS